MGLMGCPEILVSYFYYMLHDISEERKFHMTIWWCRPWFGFVWSGSEWRGFTWSGL